MSDKSNVYGYVSGGPTQARTSNTGVFEVNDVNSLLGSKDWSGLFGNLELIQTQTAATHDTEVDFTSIDETTYNTHLLTIANAGNVSGTMYMWLRFMVSGTVDTNNNYAYNYELLNQSNNTPVGDNQESYLRIPIHTENSSGAHGYVWLRGLGSSSSYSVALSQGSIGAQGVGGHGGGTYYQKNVVNGIRVTAGSYNFNGGQISLYGVNAV